MCVCVLGEGRDPRQPRPEDRYYAGYYGDSLPRDKHVVYNRANIDPYATLTPSERLRDAGM